MGQVRRYIRQQVSGGLTWVVGGALQQAFGGLAYGLWWSFYSRLLVDWHLVGLLHEGAGPAP